MIKTRIQARSQAEAQSGMVIIRNMIAKEGFSSFFKVTILHILLLPVLCDDGWLTLNFCNQGLTPKILVVGPKLVFSFTIAQQFIPLFHDLLDKKKSL